MKKAKRNVLVSAVLAIALCLSVIAGATFALFTSKSSVNIAITSGNVEVVAKADGLKTYSMNREQTDGKFENGGSAALDGNALTLNGMTPGDKVTFTITIENKSTVTVKYRTRLDVTFDNGLYSGLNCKIGEFDGADVANWATLTVDDRNVATLDCEVELPEDGGNEYKNKKCELEFVVEAVQGNADVPAYPVGVNTASFNEATTVYYSKNTGVFSIGTATTEAELANHPAVIAYEKEGAIKYAADLRAAIEDKPTVIYCKENSRIPMAYAHVDVLNDLTVYGNGAKFDGGDLAIVASGDYKAPDNMETTINLYDTVNLSVWGQPGADARVWNVNFTNCRADGKLLLMYRGEKNNTSSKINVTMTDCYATGYTDSIIHTTADGSITVKNCTFMSNCAPINLSHKQAGTMTISVEDSRFINCGKVNPANDYFAPVRLVNNNAGGKLQVTLKNNFFADTVGTNGDILLGDYRKPGKSNPFTTTIVTTSPVTVKSSEGAPYAYNGGTITVGTF